MGRILGASRKIRENISEKNRGTTLVSFQRLEVIEIELEAILNSTYVYLRFQRSS